MVNVAPVPMVMVIVDNSVSDIIIIVSSCIYVNISIVRVIEVTEYTVSWCYRNAKTGGVRLNLVPKILVPRY